jgi:hypothetical protein
MHNLQRPLQQDKRVSFLNHKAPQPQDATSPSSGSSSAPKRDVNFDSDDTFGLNDEEFLALADLVADTGRPIEQDDIGDQEESVSTTSHEVKKIDTNAGIFERQGQELVDPKQSTRDEGIAATRKVQGANIANGKTNLGQTTTIVPTPGVASTSKPLPAQSRPVADSLSFSITPSDSTSAAEALQQQRQRLYLRKQFLQNRKLSTDQNQKYHNNDPISVMKGPSVPAMGGGFNFNFSSGSRMVRHPLSLCRLLLYYPK